MFIVPEHAQYTKGGQSRGEDMAPGNTALEARHALEDAIREIEQDPMFKDAGVADLVSEEFTSVSYIHGELWDQQELQWLSSSLSAEIAAVSRAAHH